MQTDLRVHITNTCGGRGGGLLVYAKNGLQVLKIDTETTLIQLCKMMVKDLVIYVLYSCRGDGGGQAGPE